MITVIHVLFSVILLFKVVLADLEVSLLVVVAFVVLKGVKLGGRYECEEIDGLFLNFKEVAGGVGRRLVGVALALGGAELGRHAHV